MKQIICIHWGECFNQEELYTYLETTSFDPNQIKKRRRNRLQIQCRDSHEVIIPNMPNKYSSDYIARKIRFERHFGYLNDEGIVLVGHSLWASFLTKRLSENTFPKQITQLHLVWTMLHHNWIPWKWLQQFVSNLEKISNIQSQVNQIYIYHSEDDTIVPYKNAEDLAKILPNAIFVKFKNRWHLKQETFPELLENINN